MYKATLFAAFLLAQTAHLAAEGAAASAPDQGLTQTLVMVALALVFFYFILWRPEQKRRKTMDQQRASMKKGDRVICMGVVGTVSKIKEDTVVIHTGDSDIEFLKAAISEVHSQATSDDDSKKE